MSESSTTTPASIASLFQNLVEGAPPSPPEFGTYLQLPSLLAKLDAESPRDQILSALIDLARGERAFLVEFTEQKDSSGGWTTIVSRNCDGEDVRNPNEKIVTTLLDRSRERENGFFTRSLADEAIAEKLSRERQPRTQSLLIVPFPKSNHALYIDHRFQPLALAEESFFAFAWLFSLLVDGEQRRQTDTQRAQLEVELREARRNLRSRRPSSPRGEYALEPARADDSRGLRGDFSDIVGESDELMSILRLLEKIAPTSAPVLINGESGTGKELIARSIHKNSERARAPFVSENCAALAETLLETELFGHVKGAYTGANDDRPGLFEIASGGTLFLDEIGDTTPGLQKKLLRALQEGVIRRVGGGDLIEVDVRIISATNKDLNREVERGNFREDLYYRLNVINVGLPPLRDRLDDVPLLADAFVRDLNHDSPLPKKITPEFLSALTAYDWPGNIRELQNQVRRAFALSDDELDPTHLSPQVTGGASQPRAELFSLDTVLELGSLKEATEDLEKRILEACLSRYQGNKAQVCSSLNIPKTTLYAKLKRYGLLGNAADPA